MSLPVTPSDSTSNLPQSISLAEVVAHHAAPALVCTNIAVLEANPPAQALLADKSIWPHLQEWLARGSGNLVLQAGEQTCEFTSTRLGEMLWLVEVRDATLEHNLTLALADSRARYKDLLDLSSDYVWETDRAGRFAFVASKGLLGYSAEEATGKRPHELGLLPADDLTTPFFTQKPVQDAQLWIKDRSGEPRCLSISAMPRFDATGAWVGARGLCRDITDQLNAGAQLAGARLRERLVGHIIRIMRDGLSEAREFGAVVRALTHALSAEGAAIYRRHETDWALVSNYGQTPPNSTLVLCEATLNRGNALQMSSEGHEWLICRTQNQRHVNGAVMIWRNPFISEWREEETSLVEAVADQLGVIWAQITAQEEWQEKAERDGLTGLYNQRAFAEHVSERLGKHGGAGAVLMNIDLDNFKTVNDHLGHAAGDDVLKKAAAIFEASVRGGDIVGRVGGDEFLLWLERTDEAGAQAVAQRILAEISKLADALPGLPKRISASIGIAPVHANDTFAKLIKRADATMYKAKHSGKGRAEIAQ